MGKSQPAVGEDNFIYLTMRHSASPLNTSPTMLWSLRLRDLGSEVKAVPALRLQSLVYRLSYNLGEQID